MFGKHKTDPQTTFVIIAGCAGSGKTTVGKAVSSRLKWTYIDKDTVTRKYTDFMLCSNGSNEGDRESDFYCTEIRPIEYDVTFKLCMENLELGNSVVVTIPMIAAVKNFEVFSKTIDLPKLKSLRINVKTVWLNHDESLEYERVNQRNAVRDRYKLAHWYEYSLGVADIKPDERINAYTFYNEVELNFDEEINKLVKWILK